MLGIIRKGKRWESNFKPVWSRLNLITVWWGRRRQTDKLGPDEHNKVRHKTDRYGADGQKSDGLETDGCETDWHNTDRHGTDGQKTDR